jgi:hypothetical protein
VDLTGFFDLNPAAAGLVASTANANAANISPAAVPGAH